MNIFSTLFGSAPAPVSAPAPAPAPGDTNAGVGNTPGTAANGTIPPGTTPPANQSPLDKFADTWKTPENVNRSDPTIFGEVDPAKIVDAAKKIDFTKVITPDQLKAIGQGGESAVNAFASALNTVAQTVYAQNSMSSAKLIEAAMQKGRDQMLEQLPAHFKKFSASEGLATSNPLLSNPAVQPLVGALTEQFQRKNPNATSTEIQQQVADYFDTLGTAFGKKPEPTAKEKAAKSENDWSKFLES